MNNKGEIGATLTWIVATIIILVIIFVFMLVSGVVKWDVKGFTGQKEISALKFPEQQQSLYAISKTPSIRNAIINGNYDQPENEIKLILDGIKTTNKDGTGWNLEIFKNDKSVKSVVTYETLVPADSTQNFYLLFSNGDDQFKLRLYLECKDEIRGDCTDNLVYSM